MASSVQNLSSILDFIKKLVRDEYQSSANIKTTTFEEIGKKQGFMSRIYKISLTYEQPNNILPKALVIKLPSTTTVEEYVKQVPEVGEFWNREMIGRLHNREVKMYRFLHSEVSSPPLPIARLFYAEYANENHSGFAVMDFVDGKTIGFTVDYSLIQMECLAKHIAGLQIFSHKHGCPEDLGPMDAAFVGPSTKFLQANLRKIAQVFPDIFDMNEQNFQEAVSRIEKGRGLINNPDSSLDYTPVLNFGDLQPNNIMFYPDDPERIKTFIDFQFFCRGPRMYDFCTMAFFGIPSSESFFDTLDYLLDVYFSTMQNQGQLPVNLTKEKMKNELITLYPTFASFQLAYFTSKATVMDVTGMTEERINEYAKRLKFAIFDCNEP